MDTNPHFTAFLNYLPATEGLHTTPASSGQRAFISFDFLPEKCIAILHFDDAELVFPGDSVTSAITMINAISTDRLYPGLDFEFYQGDILIGSGVITKVF